jgi:probable rRNA maturation factor
MAFCIHTNYHVASLEQPSAAQFSAWVSTALRCARKRNGEVCIALVDASEGRALNRQYRDKDYATNVLSFPAELPRGVRSNLLGDLVLCAPVVADEALAQHKSRTDHYAHLCVHGTLHLLGYDHLDADAAEAMEALEIRILAKLGISDPYAEI